MRILRDLSVLDMPGEEIRQLFFTNILAKATDICELFAVLEILLQTVIKRAVGFSVGALAYHHIVIGVGVVLEKMPRVVELKFLGHCKSP